MFIFFPIITGNFLVGHFGSNVFRTFFIILLKIGVIYTGVYGFTFLNKEQLFFIIMLFSLIYQWLVFCWAFLGAMFFTLLNYFDNTIGVIKTGFCKIPFIYEDKLFNIL